MVFCYKCGKNSDNDRNTSFFGIPSATDNLEWHKAFLRSLGLERLDESEKLNICDRHFRTDDLEMKNGYLSLKENSLPFSDECEFFEVRPDLKPELVYYSSNVELAEDESYESQELAPLEPLVEYVYGDDKSSDGPSEEPNSSQEMACEEVVTCSNESGESHTMSEVNTVQPIMPFFLSSPMFTLCNDIKDEETIILQIENEDDTTGNIIPYKSRILDEGEVSRLENQLCHIGEDITEMYTCEICESSYGCINCLKSHYKTMHISTMQVMRFKCEKSPNISKYFFCPVCQLCFEDKNTTMNHYLTHSVVCSVCGSGFDRQAYLTDHMKSAHNKNDSESSFECVLCTLVYQYAVNLTKHYRLYHKMILCHTCKSRFSSVRDLQIHEKGHWPKIDILPFACSKCNKAFSKTSEIAVHIRQEHSVKQDREIDNRPYKTVYPVRERSQKKKKAKVK